MQNKYVGDVGDFGKYGLLRDLGTGFALGMVWYLFSEDERNADGGFVTFLEPTPANLIKFRECDPALYDTLAGIVRDEDRSVTSVRERGVLPAGTVFHEDELTYESMPGIGPSAKAARLARRSQWVERALDATQACDLVFLDPDNGIESGTQRHEKFGPKFVYFDEVQSYLDRGQSVVIYHHFCRRGKAPEQIRHQLVRLHERLGEYGQIRALLFQRFGLRAFFVIAAPGHEADLSLGIRRFLEGPWARHFVDVSLRLECPPPGSRK